MPGSSGCSSSRCGSADVLEALGGLGLRPVGVGHVALGVDTDPVVLDRVVVTEAGETVVVWDGKNTNGEQVSSGVYFYRLRAEGLSRAGKMVKVD